MKRHYWLAAWATAAALHALGLTLTFKQTEPAGNAKDKGALGVDIGLGAIGSYADVSERFTSAEQTLADSVNDTSETPNAREKTAPLNIKKPAPSKQTPPTPEKVDSPTADLTLNKKSTEKTLEADKKLAKVTEVIAREKPKNPMKNEASELDTQPRNENKQENNKPKTNEEKSAQTAQKQGNGLAEQSRAGGKKGTQKNYINELMRWLSQHRRYPIAAKKEKQQGKVYLQFLMTRDGNVKQHTIYKSSGHELLDRSALEMIVRATPLPAVPDDFYPGRSELQLVIPIEYSLITNSSFKE